MAFNADLYRWTLRWMTVLVTVVALGLLVWAWVE